MCVNWLAARKALWNDPENSGESRCLYVKPKLYSTIISPVKAGYALETLIGVFFVLCSVKIFDKRWTCLEMTPWKLRIACLENL